MVRQKHPDNDNLFWCSACKAYHPKAEFSRDSWVPTKVARVCKKTNKINKARQKVKRPHINSRLHPTDQTLIWCSYHKAYEPKTEFYTRKNRTSGYDSACKLGRIQREEELERARNPKPVAVAKKELKPEKKLSPWCRRMLANPVLFADTFHKPATEENVRKAARQYGM